MKEKWLKPLLAASILLGSVLVCEIVTRPNPKAFGVEYFALNYMPVLLLFLLLFAYTNKLVFSSFLSSSAAVGFVGINNTKYAVLAKPLMPSDFLLASHFLESPGLYLRYVDLASALCLCVALFCMILCYRMERKQLARSGYSVLLRVVVAAGALTFFTGVTDADSFVARTYNNTSLRYFSLDPRSSVGYSGLFYTFIRLSEGMDYSIPEGYGDPSLIERIATAPLSARETGVIRGSLPDIMVVQSESFYDLRQHELTVKGDPYDSYDRAAMRATVSGKVKVHSIGGNTAKSEFSFLTGIEGSVLPCEYPYRFLVKKNVWSIAWYLRSLGYQTIAIHPYTRTFWDRNIAYPFLGFDRFIDERYFSAGQKEGLYISDRAVAEKIAEVRKERKGPLFIFAVTMENHGPWDRKRVAKRRNVSVDGAIGAEDKKRAGRYLHHVVNAGDMVQGLMSELEGGKRPTVLAFYGDHAPGFCATSGSFLLKRGSAITETPYLVWRNFGRVFHATRDISVSFLASEILDQAGINRDAYFLTNSYIKRSSGGVFEKIRNEELQKSYTQLLYNNLSGKLQHVHFLEKKML